MVKECGHPSPIGSVENGLELVVEDKNEGTTGSSNDVREASLEEGSWSFVLENLLEAVSGSIVHGVGSGFTSVHHESSSTAFSLRDSHC